MTDYTTKLALPIIASNQSQKHVTHNEALAILDALVMAAVISQTLTAPPGSPAEGDRYIVAATATGAWAGHEEDIADYSGGGWVFYTPRIGWLVYVAATDNMWVYSGSAWVQPTPSSEFLDSVFRLQDNSDPTKQLAFQLSGLTTATTRTLTVPDASGVLALTGLAQTFNALQTFTGGGGIVVDDDVFSIRDNLDATKVVQFQVSGLTPATTRVLTIPDQSATLALGGGGTNVFTGSNSFNDTAFILRDEVDTTKRAQFQLSGITTGTTRTLTLPNVSDTLAVLGVNTFTGNQVIANTAASLSINDTDAVIGGAAFARTLFNKGGVTAGYIGYNGSVDLVFVAIDGNLTIAADHDNTEANSTINLMVDGAVVGTVEPAAAAGSGTTVMTRTRGDARYVQPATAALTGTPTAPTAGVATNNTQIATTAFVKAHYPPDLFALSDETTALTVGLKLTHRVVGARTLTGVRLSVTTAPTGATIIVDVRKNGTTIFTTKVSIDATELTSVTAAVAAVLSTTAFADDDEVTWYIDQVGSTVAGAGLKGALIWE